MRDRDGIYGDRFRHRQPLRRCQVDGIGDAMATALSRCLASGDACEEQPRVPSPFRLRGIDAGP